MAITSGVFAPRAWLQVSGVSLPVVSAGAVITTTRASSSFTATIAIGSLPPGMFVTLCNASSLNGALRIAMHGTDAQTIVSGPIDAVKPAFFHQIVEISGRDKSTDLHNTKNHEQYRNKTAHDIVKDIAGRHGLTANVDTTTGFSGKQHTIDYNKLTDGESDWSLVQHLAEIEGAKCYILGSSLFFKSLPVSGASKYVINYQRPTPASLARGDFMDLRCERNLVLGQTIQVKARSWNTKKKEKLVSNSTISGSGSTLLYEYRAPGLQKDQLDKLAKNRANEHARHEMTLTADLPGDTSIDPSMQVVLAGTGTAFDQAYEIDSINHSIDGQGYRMRVYAKSAKAGRTQSQGESTAPSDASQ